MNTPPSAHRSRVPKVIDGGFWDFDDNNNDNVGLDGNHKDARPVGAYSPVGGTRPREQVVGQFQCIICQDALGTRQLTCCGSPHKDYGQWLCSPCLYKIEERHPENRVPCSLCRSTKHETTPEAQWPLTLLAFALELPRSMVVELELQNYNLAYLKGRSNSPQRRAILETLADAQLAHALGGGGGGRDGEKNPTPEALATKVVCQWLAETYEIEYCRCAQWVVTTSHADVCPERKVPCEKEYCHSTVSIKDMKTHIHVMHCCKTCGFGCPGECSNQRMLDRLQRRLNEIETETNPYARHGPLRPMYQACAQRLRDLANYIETGPEHAMATTTTARTKRKRSENQPGPSHVHMIDD